MLDERIDVYFSILYLIIVLCFILPPKEFASAGLTIQNIFGFYLGGEDVDFIGYHLKRTTITAVVHSFFPMLYYVGLGFVAPKLHLFTFSRLSAWGALFALFCFGSAISGILLYLLWSSSNWKNHPLTKDLIKYGTPWRGVAAQINLEFRRLEKFSSVMGGTSIYVTDSWIIKCETYKVKITQQTESHLTVTKSEEFLYNQETDQAAQYLHIMVKSIPPHEKTFHLYLNSLEYSDLKDRLNAPIRNARDVVIHQTLSDRFLEAFKEQVSNNGRVEIPNLTNVDSEICIGCMANPTNIKLLKRCARLSEGECTQCYCRPMWCLECMGRWFSSRQDQNDPESWMSSLSPCPTCRSKFCMLDVFTV